MAGGWGESDWCKSAERRNTKSENTNNKASEHRIGLIAAPLRRLHSPALTAGKNFWQDVLSTPALHHSAPVSLPCAAGPG